MIIYGVLLMCNFDSKDGYKMGVIVEITQFSRE
jgi:hypothetical protein